MQIQPYIFSMSKIISKFDVTGSSSLPNAIHRQHSINEGQESVGGEGGMTLAFPLMYLLH